VLAEEPAWLVWKAPPECPTAERIAETLEQWLKRPLERDEAQVTAAVRASDAGWDVTVLVVQRELEGERSVRTRTCSEAADFVALSVALAIDPRLVGSLPEPAPTGEPPPAESSQEAEKAASDESDGKSTVVAERPQSEAAVVPDTARETPPAKRELPREQGVESGFRAHAQLSGVFDLLALPSPRLGVGGQIGLQVSRFTVSGGARWLPPRTEPVPAAVSDVEFSLLTGRARVGYSFPFGDVELEPFVEAELGRTFAESPRYSSSARWLALGAGAQATWLATSVLEPYAAIGALFPLERPTFVLSGGTEVHEVPTVTAVADVGVRINF
jgi:hypothetical protein